MWWSASRRLSHPDPGGRRAFELIHTSSESFTRVMFYYEFSILPTDLPWLSAASAVVAHCDRQGDALRIDSPYGVEFVGTALRLWTAAVARARP